MYTCLLIRVLYFHPRLGWPELHGKGSPDLRRTFGTFGLLDCASCLSFCRMPAIILFTKYSWMVMENLPKEVFREGEGLNWQTELTRITPISVGPLICSSGRKLTNLHFRVRWHASWGCPSLINRGLRMRGKDDLQSPSVTGHETPAVTGYK